MSFFTEAVNTFFVYFLFHLCFGIYINILGGTFFVFAADFPIFENLSSHGGTKFGYVFCIEAVT